MRTDCQAADTNHTPPARQRAAFDEILCCRDGVAAVFEEVGCKVDTFHSQTVEVDGEQLLAEVMEIQLLRPS